MFLRDRSADAHATLDKCVGPLDTHASYRRYVAGVSTFRLPLEAELAPIVWPELFSGYTFQPLADLVVKDMGDLDWAAPQLLPRETLPMTFERLVGMLYVLELRPWIKASLSTRGGSWDDCQLWCQTSCSTVCAQRSVAIVFDIAGGKATGHRTGGTIRWRYVSSSKEGPHDLRCNVRCRGIDDH